MTSIKETFDIVSMVKDNPLNKLSGDYESLIISKIKEQFSTDEQKLFITNCYCYINYDNENDFVVEFDNVWKMLEFGRIEECKRVLVKHFKENVDYRVEKSFPQVCGKPNLGGRPKENILLTINCFKKLCLKAGTKKADEIHDYYIKLEKIVSQTAKEESEKLRNQLQLKDGQLRIKTQENKQLKESTMLDAYDNKPTLYIALAEENVAKFGYSNGIKTRTLVHKKEIGEQFTLVYVIETIHNRELENMIKKNLKDRKISKEYPNRKELCTELIQLDNFFTIETFYKTVLKYKESIDSGEILTKLMTENEELLQKVEKLEKMTNIKVDNSDIITKLTKENEIIKQTITQIIDEGEYICISRNQIFGNIYRLEISKEPVSNADGFTNVYTYKSENASPIIKMIKLIIHTCHKQNNEYELTYETIKIVFDYCVTIYDDYIISKSEENINYFMKRFKNGSINRSDKIRESVKKDVFEKFVSENITYGEEYKLPLIYLQEEFFKWYEKIYGNADFMKSGITWSSKFRTELINNFQEITGNNMILHLSLKKRDCDYSTKYHGNAGFIGLSSKSFLQLQNKNDHYYPLEVYKKYIDEHISVTNKENNKVARIEILDDFSTYTKKLGIYNETTHGKAYSSNFITEVIKVVENHTGIKYTPGTTKNKISGNGIFIGMVHKNFNCLTNRCKNNK
jgi:hypothetical protein